jgi:WD40 repeat protein
LKWIRWHSFQKMTFNSDQSLFSLCSSKNTCSIYSSSTLDKLYTLSTSTPLTLLDSSNLLASSSGQTLTLHDASTKSVYAELKFPQVIRAVFLHASHLIVLFDYICNVYSLDPLALTSSHTRLSRSTRGVGSVRGSFIALPSRQVNSKANP